MKIQNSSQNLQSAHHYAELYQRTESLAVSISTVPAKKEAGKESSKEGDRFVSKEDLPGRKVGWEKNGYPSGLAKKQHDQAASAVDETELSEDLEDGLSIGDMKTRIMKMVLEAITGQKISVYKPDDETEPSASEEPIPTDPSVPEEPVVEQEITTTYELNELYYERESLTFEAAGQVTTEDGRSIAFAASLSQEREFFQENNLSVVTKGKLVDPLVINFDGRGVQLSADRVNFDLNSDGTEEQISGIGAGSAFLALDRNNDGTINNGSELFGPSTGSGFGELQELDSDQNGWIDENDELFYQLRLWKPGHESSALLERGVGAISLANAGGSFQIKSSEQELLGAVKSQGIWLHETTGKAGFVQEIDLTA